MNVFRRFYVLSIQTFFERTQLAIFKGEKRQRLHRHFYFFNTETHINELISTISLMFTILYKITKKNKLQVFVGLSIIRLFHFRMSNICPELETYKNRKYKF